MEYRNKLKTLLFGQDMESMVCHGLRKCMKDFPQIEADYGKARENIIHQLGEEAQRLCQSVSDQVYAALFFAGVQGLRMNRDHFQNPLMPDCTWPQVDYDNCVRDAGISEGQKRTGGILAEECCGGLGGGGCDLGIPIHHGDCRYKAGALLRVSPWK